MSESRRRGPGFAVAPDEHAAWLRDAVAAGGGRIDPIDEAEGLIWGGGDVADLEILMRQTSHLRWVQLPSAGVDRYLPAIDDTLTWTAAKGIFDEHVAEHALGLSIAGFRHLTQGARTTSWSSKGRSFTVRFTGHHPRWWRNRHCAPASALAIPREHYRGPTPPSGNGRSGARPYSQPAQ